MRDRGIRMCNLTFAATGARAQAFARHGACTRDRVGCGVIAHYTIFPLSAIESARIATRRSMGGISLLLL